MEHFYFHPMLIHFPIAFYFFEFFLLGLWIFKKDDAYKRFAFLSFRIGYVMMIAAMCAGYADAGGITPHVQKHFFSALGVFTIYTIRGVFWFKANQEKPYYRIILILSALLGVVLVGVTGDLGGDLVYTS